MLLYNRLTCRVNYSVRRAALAPLTAKFAPEPTLDPIPEPPRVSAPMHTAGPMVLGRGLCASRPAADRDRVAAAIVGAIHEQPAHTHVAHFGEGDLLRPLRHLDPIVHKRVRGWLTHLRSSSRSSVGHRRIDTGCARLRSRIPPSRLPSRGPLERGPPHP